MVLDFVDSMYGLTLTLLQQTPGTYTQIPTMQATYQVYVAALV